MKRLLVETSEVSEWQLFTALGSEGRCEVGGIATRTKPHSCEKWLSGKSTIILGQGPAAVHSPTIVSWHIPVEPAIAQAAAYAWLLVACRRTHGGLHTQVRGRVAKISVNGRLHDTIGLMHVPDGHTDYFHRLSQPPQLPNLLPVTGCPTVYSWALEKSMVRPSGSQKIRLEVDPDVSWDIDYVALAFSVPRQERHLRAGVKQVLYILLSAILGAVLGEVPLLE